MISQYNAKPSEVYGVRNLMQIVSKRITMRGFIVSDPNMSAYGPEHRQNVMKWISEGSVKTQKSVTHGIDNAPEGFVGMLKGENFGKAVLEISPLPGWEGKVSHKL
jgi:NADPH-dependent curcumin reductase CurA